MKFFLAVIRDLYAGVFCLALLSACSPRVQAPDAPVLPGQKVEFTLPTVSGASASSTALRGRYVLLHFWATWCIPCMEELPALQQFASRLQSSDISVLAVAVESDWDSVESHLKSNKITLPCLLDRRGDLKNAFGIRGVPSTFLLDRQGRLTSIPDPHDGTLHGIISGPRDWTANGAADVFKSYLK